VTTNLTPNSTQLRTDYLLPIWREPLAGVDWASLRISPVYYGIGVPHGNGAPVILVPGFLWTDFYLTDMYIWLQRIGYRPYFSRTGHNADCLNILSERLLITIGRVCEETGQGVHLIGHSLGGTLARSVAGRCPEQIASVTTLASPFRSITAHLLIVGASRLVRSTKITWRRWGGEVRTECFTGQCECPFALSLRAGLPTTTTRTALYTTNDGIVDWRCCVEDDDRHNQKVKSTHLGMPFSSDCFRQVARALANHSKVESAIA
jgi:pimeloyl-ACP methyl ester carboxylesterase